MLYFGGEMSAAAESWNFVRIFLFESLSKKRTQRGDEFPALFTLDGINWLAIIDLKYLVLQANLSVST